MSAGIAAPNVFLSPCREQAKHPLMRGKQTAYPTRRGAGPAKLDDQVNQHCKVIFVAAKGCRLYQFVEADLTECLDSLNRNRPRVLGRRRARLKDWQESLNRSLDRARRWSGNLGRDRTLGAVLHGAGGLLLSANTPTNETSSA